MTKHVRYVNLKLHCKVQHEKLLPVRQLGESTVYFTSTVLQLVINLLCFQAVPCYWQITQDCTLGNVT